MANGENSSGGSLDTVLYRLNEMAKSIESLANRLDTNYVRFDIFEASKQLAEAERVQINSRIEKLESRSEWLIRTVGGFIILAVLGGLFTVAKAVGGAG